MKILGIIAEYNPFHDGHQFHIEASKEATGCDYCVVVMSGNFVQRGEPAIVDKYLRTRMALSCGADLVIEMPSTGALSSAEGFASCGIAILNAIGCDCISFGAETDNIDILNRIADILIEEPPEFKKVLTEDLKSGLVFPTARANALTAMFDEKDSSTVIAGSNNILAIEYLKAIKRQNAKLTPFIIKRKGADYNSKSMDEEYVSATAVRDYVFEYPDYVSYLKKIPEITREILTNSSQKNACLNKNDFSQLLYAALLNADGESDLDNRIQNSLEEYTDFESFCQMVKSKNQTYTGISRHLTHLMLGITDEYFDALKNTGYAPYVRILGFKKSAGLLLRNIRLNCSVPVISSAAKDRSLLDEDALKLFNLDIKCTDIYNYILFTKSGEKSLNDFRHPQVII